VSVTGPRPLGRDELLGRARALVPALAVRALDAEQRRQIPEQTVRDLWESGLLLAGRPERFGGQPVDFDTLMEVAAVLGEGCGSTAWCYAVWVNHNWLVGLYADPAQQEFYGTAPDVLASSAFNPMGGKVGPAADGYTLHGRWDFSSGADAASWALLGGVTPDAGPGLFLVPRSRYRIQDTWFVSGLEGTGSKDVVIEEPVFVPSTHFVSYAAAGAGASPGRELSDRPSYRVPMYSILPWTLVAPLIGIAQGAVDGFRDQCRGRLAQVPDSWDPAPALARLAEAAAETDCARLLMVDHLREAIARGAGGAAFPLADRVRYRRDYAFAAGLAVRAVTRLFEASGGHALYREIPIQRHFRDVHAGSHQVAIVWDTAAQSWGRVQVGLQPEDQIF
jgi:alkylation response protein AidB-like acyl-CoA dehydrogenase